MKTQDRYSESGVSEICCCSDECLRKIFWSYFFKLFVTEKDCTRYIQRWKKTSSSISFKQFMDIETNM